MQHEYLYNATDSSEVLEAISNDHTYFMHQGSKVAQAHRKVLVALLRLCAAEQDKDIASQAAALYDFARAEMEFGSALINDPKFRPYLDGDLRESALERIQVSQEMMDSLRASPKQHQSDFFTGWLATVAYPLAAALYGRATECLEPKCIYGSPNS